MSINIKDVRRAYQRSIKKVRDERINGIVGRGANYADVAGPRRNHIWVTIADSEMLIRNTGPGRVLARAGLPVKLIRRFNGDLVLDGNDVSGMLDDDANNPGDVFFVNDIGPDSHGNVILDSDDIPEGSTNVYYTAERARDDIGTALVEGAGIDIIVSDPGDTITIASTITQYTDEAAQDAVGLKGIDTATIDFTYTDATPEFKWDVINDSITFAKFQNIATDSLVGRDTASTGDAENILLNATLSMDGSGNLQRAALTGDVTASAGSNATAIGANKVLTAMIADAQVTLAKLANIATDSLIGRDTAGSGVPENILLNATLSMDGSGNLQRAALTGDVTASAGSNATTIAANAVTDTKLRDSALLSVIGRSANSAGDPADIAAVAASGAVLRESGSVLGFGSIATAGITNNAVTSGKIADNAVTNTKLNDMANATVKGRTTAGTGDPEDLTMAQLVALIEVQALYALLAGRSGGQTLKGDTLTGGNLTLESTAHATKGDVIIASGSGFSVGADPLKANTFHIGTTDGTLAVRRYAASANGPALTLGKSRNAAVGSHTAVNSADEMGKILFYGSDGSAFQNGAAIVAKVDGTPGAADMPGRIEFQVSPAGSATPATALTIFNDKTIATGGLASVGASQLGIKAGTSTNDAAVGGVLSEGHSATGNVGTGEDDLLTYGVPANTLSANGMSLWFEASGTSAANANAKTLRVRFGTSGTSLIAQFTVTGGGSGSNWVVRGRIIRTGAATQKGYASIVGSNITNTSDLATGLDQTLTSGTVSLRITGEATSNNDIVCQSLIVGYDDQNT